jgi:hypothetical protein
MGVMVIPLPSAPMATTATILTPARPMDTMARRGSMAASSSAPAPGSAAATAAAFMDIAAASMDALFTAMDGQVMDTDARASVAAIAEARLEVASAVVDSTAVRASVAVADSTVAAVVEDSTAAVDMVAVDIGKASIPSLS